MSNQAIPLSKIETLRKDEKKYTDYYNFDGSYKGASSYGKFENWKAEPMEGDE